MDANISQDIRDLLSRRQIEDAIIDYMRGQDRLEPETQRRAFHEDAHVDCGLFAGTRDAYVDFAQSALGACQSSHHLAGQIDIKIHGQFADGEVYFVAWHRYVGEDGLRDLLVGGRYIDLYECRDGAWKILRRTLVTDWSRTEHPEDHYIESNPTLVLGSRKDDFSVRRPWRRAAEQKG